MIPFIKTIGFRLWLACSLAVIAPLGANIILLAASRYRETLSTIRTTLQEDSAFKTSTIAKIIPLNENALAFLSDSLDLDDTFPEAPNPILSQEMVNLFHDVFQDLSIVKLFSNTDSTNTSGMIVASMQPGKLGQPYKTFLPSPPPPFHIQISYSEETKDVMVLSTSLVFNKNTRSLEGLISASYQANAFFEDLLIGKQDHYIIQSIVLSKDFTIIKSLNTQHLLHKVRYKDFNHNKNSFSLFLKPHPSLGENFVKFYMNRQEMWGYLEEIPSLEIFILSFSPKKMLLSSFQSRCILYIVYLSLVILGSTLAYLIAKFLSYPIRNLATVMSKTRYVDNSQLYSNLRFGFEINRLGDIFNSLINHLREQKHLAKKNFADKEIALQELQLGERAQNSLLPQNIPYYPGIESFHTFVPAKNVGGDFFDIFIKGEGESSELFIIVADASGKGVSACGYSLFLKNMLKTFLLSEPSIEAAISKTSSLFFENTNSSGMFVTLCIYKYCYQSRTLTYYSCGHPPGLFISHQKEASFLSHPGMALGFVPEIISKQAFSLTPQKNSILILYSDGVTETHNASKQLFGDGRLKDVALKYHEASPDKLTEALLNSLKTFVNQEPQYDDITLFVIKFL